VCSVGTNAEDTLQQALLQAWSAIGTGVEVRDPRAWLYRIVHNVAVSNQRRPVVVPVEVREMAGARGADQEAEQRMAARDALAGLAALPDLQREVMVGTAVDGMSHEELASALGLSSGAVRGLIYRARATLRAAAAAITPGPLISWALRSGSGPGAGLYEALAGGGTAGIGGILIKGGAIAATAGAIATASGISTSHTPVHHRATPAVAAARPHVVSGPASGASQRVLVADPTSSHAGFGRGSAPDNPTPADSGRGSSDGDDFSATSGKRESGKRHDGGDGGGNSGPVAGHDGDDAGSGSGTSSSHEGSGSGSGSSGSTSGTGSTTVTSPSGSGDDSGKDGTSSGASGSGSSGSGSGDSLPSGDSTLTSTAASSGGSSGSGSGSGSSGSGSGSSGSGSGSSGSGHDGGTTTTTTTTSDDDGSSDSGHHGGK
jgi:RNA polymerase sigma factor (sigma-70 family)